MAFQSGFPTDPAWQAVLAAPPSGGTSGVAEFATVAALRASSTTAASVRVLGFAAANDGFAGTFIYRASGGGPDDSGVTTIVVTGNGRKYEREVIGAGDFGNANRRMIESFFPPGFDPKTTNCSAYFEAASAWSQTTGGTVTADATYLFTRFALIGLISGATIGPDFYFVGATFLVRDDGAKYSAIYSGYGTLWCCFAVTAQRTRLLGKARFLGHSSLTPGLTRLCHLWLDHAHGAEVGQFHYERAAFGLMAATCDDIIIGDQTADGLWGRQLGSDDGAGSHVVLLGCRNPTLGNLHALNNDKPIFYASAGLTTGPTWRDNENVKLGVVSGTGRVGSPWMQALGLRSAKGLSCVGVNVTGASMPVNVERYSGDENLSVDRISIGYINAEIIDTPSSVDAGLHVRSDAPSTLPIGQIDIGSMNIKGPSGLVQVFGAIVLTGRVSIGQLAVEGCLTGLQAQDAHLEIGGITTRNTGYAPVRLGGGLSGNIGTITALTGPTGADAPGVVETLAAGGSTGRLAIGSIRYTQGGAAFTCGFAIYDQYGGTPTSRGRANLSLRDSGGLSCHVVGFAYRVSEGQLLSAAKPTASPFAVGERIWQQTPVVGQPNGWVCTVAGSPGTLVDLPNL